MACMLIWMAVIASAVPLLRSVVVFVPLPAKLRLLLMLLLLMMMLLLLIHHWVALGPMVVSIRRAALILGLGRMHVGLAAGRSGRVSLASVALLAVAVTAMTIPATTIGIGICAIPLHLVLQLVVRHACVGQRGQRDAQYTTKQRQDLPRAFMRRYASETKAPIQPIPIRLVCPEIMKAGRF